MHYDPAHFICINCMILNTPYFWEDTDTSWHLYIAGACTSTGLQLQQM